MDIVNYLQLKNYIVAETAEKLAVCTKNRKGTFDYENRAGSLSKILKKLEIETDNVFEYFEIIDNPFLDLEKKCICRVTGKEFKTNRDGSLTRHIRDQLGLTPEEYLKKFPEESQHFPAYQEKINRKELFKDEDSYITCPLCNKKMKKITRTHIEFKHGMDVETFKKKTGLVVLSSKKTRKIKQKNYFEKNKLLDQGFNKLSKEEKELRAYVESLGISSHLNKRKYLDGIEIDIFIPEKNIGIEYNGLYYHSENKMGRGREYHVNKTEVAEKNGIHLIQIFSDEWKFKKDIVKQKLKHLLLSEKRKRIHGRKCTIKEVTNIETKPFLERYHIQGSTPSTYKLGAFYEDELVGVATFSTPRTSVGRHNSTKRHLELVRLCINPEYSIPGILPRFLKRITELTEYSKIISYADRRWTSSISNVYQKTGFILSGISKPSYWYTRYYDIRYHRYTFAKHKLKERELYIEGLTEWECMKEHKFDRIWDCGNLKYEWKQ